MDNFQKDSMASWSHNDLMDIIEYLKIEETIYLQIKEALRVNEVSGATLFSYQSKKDMKAGLKINGKPLKLPSANLLVFLISNCHLICYMLNCSKRTYFS